MIPVYDQFPWPKGLSESVSWGNLPLSGGWDYKGISGKLTGDYDELGNEASWLQFQLDNSTERITFVYVEKGGNFDYGCKGWKLADDDFCWSDSTKREVKSVLVAWLKERVKEAKEAAK